MLTRKAATVIFFVMGLCSLSLVDGQTLHGRVLDAATGEPISGASLMISETTIGTATAANGTFTLIFPNVPAVLVVSHLSYKPLVKEVRFIDETEAEFILEPLVHELDPVDIQANKVTEVLEGTHWEVLDFEFLDDQLLLLANENGNIYKPRLLLCNLDGDTLSSLKINRPGEFYRDFEGNVHLLTSGSALRVSARGERLRLTYVMDKEGFLATYPSVVDLQHPFWMLRQPSMEQLKLSYYRYDESDSSYTLYCSVTDQAAISRYCRGTYFDGTEADNYFATHMMNKPVVAPMFRIDSGYLVFNFVDHCMEAYDLKGNNINRVQADFLKDKNIKPQVYRDRQTGEFYVLREKAGVSSLYLVDLQNGTSSLTAQIPDFIFVENIIIRQGEAFFLYRDHLAGGEKKIYRMKM